MPKPTHAIVVSAREQEVYRHECEFDYSDFDACCASINEAILRSGYYDKLRDNHHVVFRIEPLNAG